jgi:tetratricopeptide (TPR) repeat protein
MPASSMEKPNASSPEQLANELSELLESGKDKEGDQLMSSFLSKIRKEAESDLLAKPVLVSTLEVAGDFYREAGEGEKAVEAYEEALRLLGTHRESDESIGRLCAGLAVTHDLAGRTLEAKALYERAVVCFERLSPPSLLDVAELSNNLAFIYEAEENFDEAETLFLKALRITHEQLGEFHQQTAALCNNVGSLYFKAGYAEQAREMHMMSLDIRSKVFGEHHLETAQSHGNLALVLFKSNEIDAAKRHFDRALDAYEGNLAEGRDDYDIVVANYRDVLELLGEAKSLKILDARLK